MRTARRHALVVGGTGMLRRVSLELARRGYTTSVIARSRGPLAELAAESGGRVQPIALDYRHTDELVRALDQAVAAHGPIELVVAWIHAVAPDAPLVVARAAAGKHRVDYFHVLGSAADDPSRPDPERRKRFAAVAGLAYHEVILGFVVESGSSRWLTNDEIAAGVLEAIDSGDSRRVVGTTRPWSARP
jgi:saccharopine dehydrogenase-like NADP-dependent oxidoreductase